ncbi:hypothetical protein HanXRQr2_Chr01g0002471 [Helianthus annuus]|uniref:Uncharacterized protein n=1 Tax=Helianthus annuus TaxID=4232 RepID=A0A9K3JS97_HELAN|nr:hypothetical protein HanXRQr2_Chr01g0002471 [Helianthus annuus]
MHLKAVPHHVLLKLKSVRFKEKTPRDGERSPLLHPESHIVTKIKSIFHGNRSWSLPVKQGSNMSPSITTPVSARTYSEQQKSQVFLPITLFLYDSLYNIT